MRVITGKAKGRKLLSVPGDSTRPITDRAKSALFSIVNTWIEGTRVLDLFGGTGGVGIECLSRGAAHATFIDNNRHAVETIQANLKQTGLAADATVIRGDSFQFLERYQGEPFDFVYIAPPQYEELWRKALLLVDAKEDLTAEYATIVVQIHPVESGPIELQRLQEYDRRKYGSVMLIFYADARDLAAGGEAASQDVDEVQEPSDDSAWADKDVDDDAFEEDDAVDEDENAPPSR